MLKLEIYRFVQRQNSKFYEVSNVENNEFKKKTPPPSVHTDPSQYLGF